MFTMRSEKESDWVRFGAYEVNAREREVLRKGVRLRLQDQPLSILLHLIEYAGELVTREQLRQQLWPAGTYVDFERGLTVAMHKLRLSLDDPASNPRFIETVPGRGYRLIAPVVTRNDRAGTAPRPRVVILPFSSFGEGEGLDLFADGLTDELTAQLARSAAQRLDIVARSSATRYQNSEKGISAVARELGASHVVEGSVRSSGAFGRVHVRLIQVNGESHLWADSFDHSSSDTMYAQVEIADMAATAVLGILLPHSLPSTWTLSSAPVNELSVSH